MPVIYSASRLRQQVAGTQPVGIRDRTEGPTPVKRKHSGGRHQIKLEFKHPVPEQAAHPVTMGAILKAAIWETGVSEWEITSPSRLRRVAYARNIFCALAYAYIKDISLPMIGRFVGNRHHTTIMHAIAVCKKLYAEDPDFAAKVERIRAKAFSISKEE